MREMPFTAENLPENLPSSRDGRRGYTETCITAWELRAIRVPVFPLH
jgi:hypothetical protein